MRSAAGATPSMLDALVARHGSDPFDLLQVLREVQERAGGVDADAVTGLCERLRLPRTKIVGAASFYSFLELGRHGRYRILFSDNVTDRMAGSDALVERLCAAFGVREGELSADGLVSVARTSCTGMCDQAPALLANGLPVPRLDAARVDRIASLVRAEVLVDEWPRELFDVVNPVHRRGPVLGPARGAPGQAPDDEVVRAILARGAEGTLAEVEASKLRGRGGAGFSTGAKWRACRASPGDARYVVCNADEGEPGTFKDRVLLTERAHLVLDGMTACALAIGAREGLVYLRGEYRYLLEPLEAALRARRAAGLLGRSTGGRPGFDFDVRVHVGAGAYVCGEESALLESLEGKRGTPRNRPPFPVEAGYRGRPTVVNNVETFACAALVALHGARWFAATGTKESTGTKLLSVSGDCERRGVFEVPFGTTVAQVLDEAGARDVQAVQVSGPSGRCLAPPEFGHRLAFEDVPTAGALMVFDHTRDLFEVARNFVHFFAHESCGFCTPCRVGTTLLRKLMDKLADGRGSPYDFEQIEQLNGLLKSLSHCGLGHSACNPVLDTIERFRPAYERRLLHRQFVPAFDLDAALAPARAATGRDDPGAHLAATAEERRA